MATNRDLLKETIADAKAVKETAIANAKLALEEAFTPHLKSMLAAKLDEMEKEDDVKEEVVDEKMDSKDKEKVDEKKDKEDLDEMDAVSWNDKNNPTRSSSVSLKDPRKVGQSTSNYSINEEEEIDEEINLDELLAELDEAKNDSKKGNKEEQKRMEGAIRDDRDHIKDLEKDIADNERKLAKLKKDEPKDVSEEMKKSDDEQMEEAMRGGPMYDEDDTMRTEQEDVDVDVDEKEDINVDVEKDVDVDYVSKESDIEVKSELPGEDADVSAILGLLTKAQEKATDMGDEKLMDQIGNTITYYTRAHVVAEAKDEDDVKEEMKDKKDDVKEELNEEVARFKKLAGLIK